jgi:uncharacterized protein
MTGEKTMTEHASAYDQDRAITLDALRGFAVMGILAMNIIAFAMPDWAYITPAAYGGDSLADRMTWLVSFVLIDGKMRGLFSLLFGASMMLIIERAEANRQSARQAHYTRMGWLAVFGLVHYFFIWFGDILFLYAAIGSLAFIFRNWQAQRLIKWALIIYAIGFAIWAGQFGGIQVMQFLAAQPGADPAVVETARAILESENFDIDPAPFLELYRGGYSGILADRLSEWVTPVSLVVQSATETLPLMMIGIATQKNGFITGQWPRGDYLRWAKRLIIPGLIINAALGVWVVLMNYDPVTALAALLGWGLLPRILLTIGYAALLILIIQRLDGNPFLARVAAAGRAAFTNYLGTSIIMTTIFYGYGFGLFGYVSRSGLLAFVFGAWIVMLLWSKPWLDRFHYGPMEWLWRSLAKSRLQPMRRTARGGGTPQSR